MKSKLRSSLEIPSSIEPNDVMEALRIGHGYQWTRLVLEPKFMAHGNPPSSKLPELLFIGIKTLILSGGSPEFPERIEKMIDAICRSSKRKQKLSGGRYHG
ncbi:MAG: hypothetical protein BAJATHORv1_40147 [Candidatus Thorarchaeota archaeon]|nr:MAG: hypothetical protein BAJATHORv1_40147 [Candidatus Thorarchaeota archaeon]